MNDDKQSYQSLVQLRESQADLAEVVAVLKRFPKMYTLPPSPALTQALIDHAAASGVEPYIPQEHCTIHEGEFIPAVFTSMEFANHIARVNNHCQPGAAILIAACSWQSGFYRFISNDYGGVIIDGGQEHKICFTKHNLTRAASLFLMESLAQYEKILAVKSSSGELGHEVQGTTQVFVYDAPINESGVAEFLKAHVIGPKEITFLVQDFGEVLKESIASNAFQLIINLGLPDARYYSSADLKVLEQIRA
ncbi:MAG: hypothetical protein J5J00_14920 [Deltaproteobacteria bacterium]|nr:hypothetical protein [Deltaproteobacteria bacterium]